MDVCRTISAIRDELAPLRRDERVIGLVPTMGALHRGHLALMEAARRACDCVVASIFVNPTQFGPNEDFAQYPRDEAGDFAKCRDVGVDVAFVPTVEEMYPQRRLTTVTVAELQDTMCGATRPGHFDGVTTVVSKLLHIVRPQRAYFGEKDYQQLAIIRRMVSDLDLPVEIIGCPTVREPDGLALSSRNQYLTPEQRRQAPVLYQALQHARHRVGAGERDAGKLIAEIREMLERSGPIEIDYIAIVDPDTLQPLPHVDRRARAALAARIGKTRLIDNVSLAV